MSEDLRTVLQELGDQPATLTYSVGAAPRGWTRLSLDTAGKYELRSTVTDDRSERAYAGTLEPARARRVFEQIRDERLWEAEHVRKRAPGEPPARIEVTADGREGAVELWTSEVARVPGFQRVTDTLVSLIAEVSGGEVREPGR